MYVRWCLDVKAEVHDVAVLHDIILAFDAHLPGIAHGAFAAEGDVVFVLDDLGAYESFSKSVCMMPAACGALVPRRNVQARTSSGPAVKYVCRSSSA